MGLGITVLGVRLRDCGLGLPAACVVQGLGIWARALGLGSVVVQASVKANGQRCCRLHTTADSNENPYVIGSLETKVFIIRRGRLPHAFADATYI